MPPSPALRYSPGREPRADGHKRGRSLESGLLFREKDDDLALFSEMQSRERESFLLQSSDDLEDSFSTKLRHFSDVNLGISIPGRGETSDLLNDGDKNDYDWLLTPPDTPLFPSLDDEPPATSFTTRGRPQSKPISISRSSTMDRSYRSSRGSASPNRLSPSPRSRTNTLQSRGRPSSVPNSSPTPSLRSATPSRRPSPPPHKPMTPTSKYSSYTPRRMSTGSSGSVVSSGVRGTSPVKTSRGNSASPKIRAWQTNIPGFSSEAPPNLRTSLADRPASYVRGSSPASRNGRDSTSKFSRQSMSPTASRSSSSFHSHERDQFSSRSKGSVASSGDDDLDSLQSIAVGSLDRLSSRRSGSFSTNRTPTISKKSPRMVSPSSAPKRSFDSAIRQMDRKIPQNMFRPLLSSVPSTTFYAGKANSAHRSLVSRNSSVTTSSNASSDQGTNFALDTEGSDHNQDDMASEADKILYPDIHEEVFAFDKIDSLNTNIEHEINRESVDVLQNKTRPKIVVGPIESENSTYHDHTNTKTNESSETSHVRGDFSETGSFENTAICSHCRCCYEVTDQAVKNIGLCPDCSRKTTLLRVIIPETTLAVSDDSSLITKNMPNEEKSLSETNQPSVASELPRETAHDWRFPFGEQDAEESQPSCSEPNQDYSQNSLLPNSLAEGGRQTSGNQLEMNLSGVDIKKPDNEFGDQHLYPCSNRPNLNMDSMEGTGISVLLERSSSNKGSVVQGRTFTATIISYDDLSLARGSVNSFRSSTRPGSYAASSSTDFSSTRQTDFRVQRQLSGRKLDMDCGYDLRTKPPNTGSSFSGASNHSHHELGLATRETSVKVECGFLEEMPRVLQENQASGNTVTDVIDASSIGSVVVEEDKLEYDDCSRVNNACSSEFLSQAAGVQSDDNLVASIPNLGDCGLYENVEDHPNNARGVSNSETSVKALELSSHEKHDMQSSNVNELDALVMTNCSTITESEIEGENYSDNNVGVVNDELSKGALNDFQELSAQNPSNDCHTASVSELNASESHGIEGSTVTVECQGAGNTSSLTFEEAADTLLFCSSIIHDLAYQAATIAMEKECSNPFEGSEPTVTLLGKANSDRKERRSRPVIKRTLKSPKTKQRRVETDVKTPSGKTENDENIDESFTHNVGLPNKVDSMKPPKLESKCNCIIM
ncbi:serine/arginine repetitive matrix protein 2-like [Abrus precatorius]|uniref:Serine/arginine repetitive matrix protein 2-like n=1 Tax=Abrus precatorius TaxID=3816 RepID=A0A8B8JYT9_ABRPR|nr:serine/arginine repetitive matrix protein 2-like [Abrus precatorius]XP_027336444.1 serine/arginine repetitive matrix protein 2-like [Abrus precatorius]